MSNDNEKLSQADRAAIAAYAASATWPSGFMLYESAGRADGVFVVLRGCIVLRNRVKAGRGFVPAMAGSGETFGSEGLARNGRYATDARADGEAETLHLSSAAFRAYVREQPQQALALFGQIMRERAMLLQRMRELATLGVEQRLILALLRMARSRAYTSDSGQVVLGTSQYRLLCEMVGATRESVSLVLGRLAREGLVSRDGVRYIIAPPTALEQRLEGPAEHERSLALTHADDDERADLGARDAPVAAARPGARLVYSGVHDSHEAPQLTAEELIRYNRHVILPGVGTDGQRRLKQARVLIVGAGGLGSPIAMYLAAAGVGHLGIVDSDIVDRSNLQRQILHGTGDIGRRKTASAVDRLAEINPNVEIVAFDEKLTSANALDVLAGYDIVVDGTDNFPTRYLVNDACVLLGTPNVYGTIIRFEGQASVFGHENGPCYRCLFPEPPAPGLVPNCAEGGVFGVVPGIVGSIQATEAIKLVLGLPDTLSGRLLLIDVMRMRFRTVEIRRDPKCPACGTREIRDLIDYDVFCGMPGTGTAADAVDTVRDITPRELASRLKRGDEILLLDVRERSEWAIARIEGAQLIPLATLQGAVPSLDRSREIVIHCHHGIRSAAAVRLLQSEGFRHVFNLAGGIARWSAEVDSGVPQY